jgi:hypothetical protein
MISFSQNLLNGGMSVMALKSFQGKTLEELQNTPIGTLTSLQKAFVDEHTVPKKKEEAPGFFGKAALLAKAAVGGVKERMDNFSCDVTLAMVRQSMKDKENASLNKEMALANLDILLKHGKITRDEYDATLEEMVDA